MRFQVGVLWISFVSFPGLDFLFSDLSSTVVFYRAHVSLYNATHSIFLIFAAIISFSIFNGNLELSKHALRSNVWDPSRAIHNISSDTSSQFRFLSTRVELSIKFRPPPSPPSKSVCIFPNVGNGPSITVDHLPVSFFHRYNH